MDNEKKQKTFFLDKVPILNKIKSIKHFEIYILLFFVLILGIIYFTSFSKKKDASNKTAISSFSVEEYTRLIEDKLKKVLSSVAGAGNINVMVMIENGIEYIYATESEEVSNTSTTSNGISNKTKTENVLLITKNGSSTPVVVKEKLPQITGVIVVSSGANNPNVRLQLLSAVEALFGVNGKNIEILIGN